MPLDKNQSDRGVRYLPVDTADRERITFLQVRAVFPLSDWRGYSIARAHYEATLRHAPKRNSNHEHRKRKINEEHPTPRSMINKPASKDRPDCCCDCCEA